MSSFGFYISNSFPQAFYFAHLIVSAAPMVTNQRNLPSVTHIKLSIMVELPFSGYTYHCLDGIVLYIFQTNPVVGAFVVFTWTFILTNTNSSYFFFALWYYGWQQSLLLLLEIVLAVSISIIFRCHLWKNTKTLYTCMQDIKQLFAAIDSVLKKICGLPSSSIGQSIKINLGEKKCIWQRFCQFFVDFIS